DNTVEHCRMSRDAPKNSVWRPPPALCLSLPPLPSRTLLRMLPVIVSLPPPPMAFSIHAVFAIDTLLVIMSQLEKDPGARLIVEGVFQPDRSRVSLPLAS